MGISEACVKLILFRLSEQKAKKRRGKTGAGTPKVSTGTMGAEASKEEGAPHPAYRGAPGSPYPRGRTESSGEGRGRSSRQGRRALRRLTSEPAPLHRWAEEHGMVEAARWRQRRPRLSRSLGGGDQESRGSRSPSPAPSSSMESHSIKDSPVLLDHDTVSEGAYSSEDCREVQAREGAAQRSVMAGGGVKVCSG